MKKINFILNAWCIIEALAMGFNIIGAGLALVCAAETPLFILVSVLCGFNAYCIDRVISKKTDELIEQKLDLVFNDVES